MAKPPNWEFLDHLMVTYYPKEYKRILSEQQTTLPLPPLDKKKGETNASRNRRSRSKQKDSDHSR